jgi:hypothetical protein
LLLLVPSTNLQCLMLLVGKSYQQSFDDFVIYYLLEIAPKFHQHSAGISILLEGPDFKTFGFLKFDVRN